MAVVAGKSKTTAYLLWFFLGWCSAHKFYLEKTGIGILYLPTGQLFGIGWLIDLFTLGSQVDNYNLLHGLHEGPGVLQGLQSNNQNNQNIVVNVAAPTGTTPEVKISAEKQILALSEKSSSLSLKHIVSQTSLDMEEAEEAVKKLVSKGMAKEQVSSDGKLTYDFS
ncbi:MAG: TM2 domain-containing protein [Treponema sp.]|jgi:TM2 domain-containing membrane protein YozV|nr:TM2 domain-containing protein [Treponema sp.]